MFVDDKKKEIWGRIFCDRFSRQSKFVLINCNSFFQIHKSEMISETINGRIRI